MSPNQWKEHELSEKDAPLRRNPYSFAMLPRNSVAYRTLEKQIECANVVLKAKGLATSCQGVMMSTCQMRILDALHRGRDAQECQKSLRSLSIRVTPENECLSASWGDGMTLAKSF